MPGWFFLHVAILSQVFPTNPILSQVLPPNH
jgi:hypothetical protein